MLCMLYLPVPEFVAMFFFQGGGFASNLLAFAMVMEVLIAIVTYVTSHNCPACECHVPQIRLHGNCKCHRCGFDLLEFQEMLDGIAKESEEGATGAVKEPGGLTQN